MARKGNKYPLVFGDGQIILRYSVEDATQLKRKRKATQMRFVAETWGLNIDWVMARDWNVFKSGNLAFHPATYTLEIHVHASETERVGSETSGCETQVLNMVELWHATDLEQPLQRQATVRLKRI